MIRSETIKLLNNYFNNEHFVINCASDNQEYSFNDVQNQWRKILKPGNVVLIALPNSSMLLKHYFAVLFSGGVPLLIAPGTPTERINETINHFGVNHIAAKYPKSYEFISLCDIKVSRALTSSNQLQFEYGDVILSTSGTSGIGTGCVFSFEALIENARKHANIINITKNDVMLINLPLYYSYAFVAQALATILGDGTLIIAGPPFDINTYIDTIRKYSVSISSLTPLLAEKLVEMNINFPNTLRALTIGGDKINAQYVRELLNIRPKKELYLTYGLTQAGPRVATLKAHEEPEHRFDSVGLPLIDTYVQLKHKPDISADVGELYISSNTMLKGYIKSINGKGKYFTHSGPIATGDLFSQDNEGYLYFHGRCSDFLIINGEKVSLSSVRQIAKQLPNVVHATTKIKDVLGQKHFELFIYVFDTSKKIENMLSEKIKRMLLRYERPFNLHFIDAQNMNYHK